MKTETPSQNHVKGKMYQSRRARVLSGGVENLHPSTPAATLQAAPVQLNEIWRGRCGKCGDPWTWGGLTKQCRPWHQAAQVDRRDLPAEIATHPLFVDAEWWQTPPEQDSGEVAP